MPIGSLEQGEVEAAACTPVMCFNELHICPYCDIRNLTQCSADSCFEVMSDLSNNPFRGAGPQSSGGEGYGVVSGIADIFPLMFCPTIKNHHGSLRVWPEDINVTKLWNSSAPKTTPWVDAEATLVPSLLAIRPSGEKSPIARHPQGHLHFSNWRSWALRCGYKVGRGMPTCPNPTQRANTVVG